MMIEIGPMCEKKSKILPNLSTPSRLETHYRGKYWELVQGEFWGLQSWSAA